MKEGETKEITNKAAFSVSGPPDSGTLPNAKAYPYILWV